MNGLLRPLLLVKLILSEAIVLGVVRGSLLHHLLLLLLVLLLLLLLQIFTSCTIYLMLSRCLDHSWTHTRSIVNILRLISRWLQMLLHE